MSSCEVFVGDDSALKPTSFKSVLNIVHTLQQSQAERVFVSFNEFGTNKEYLRLEKIIRKTNGDYSWQIEAQYFNDSLGQFKPCSFERTQYGYLLAKLGNNLYVKLSIITGEHDLGQVFYYEVYNGFFWSTPYITQTNLYAAIQMVPSKKQRVIDACPSFKEILAEDPMMQDDGTGIFKLRLNTEFECQIPGLLEIETKTKLDFETETKLKFD